MQDKVLTDEVDLSSKVFAAYYETSEAASVSSARLETSNLAAWLSAMSNESAEAWARANADYALREELHGVARGLVTDAYQRGDRVALGHMHAVLALIYERDFSSASPAGVDCETQPILRDMAAVLEAGMLQDELRRIRMADFDDVPRRGPAFVKWLKKMISNHASSSHPLYHNYLHRHASREDLAFYLTQETNLDPRFDDILAMLQIGLDQKLEIAKNYFDEMGNGLVDQIHSRLFQAALEAVGVDETFVEANVLLGARISGNLSACLALSRRHYYKAVGYFGVTEYLAPRRFKHVIDAWRRNGLPEAGVAYHRLHIEVDSRHANGWFENVVTPLVEGSDFCAREIALGATMRLNSSERYLDDLMKFFEAKRSLTTSSRPDRLLTNAHDPRIHAALDTLPSTRLRRGAHAGHAERAGRHYPEHPCVVARRARPARRTGCGRGGCSPTPHDSLRGHRRVRRGVVVCGTHRARADRGREGCSCERRELARGFSSVQLARDTRRRQSLAPALDRARGGRWRRSLRADLAVSPRDS
jgi:pyrroloquinoline quinone (PQQ) biosynthesis protein C